MKKSFLMLALCVALSAFAQSGDWIQVQDIDVVEGGKKLSMPWAGGMNLPQFSSMDIDGNGEEDLVVFERDGDVIRTFLYKDGRYSYAPQYAGFFPRLRNWALLEDHNGDGKKDIFAFNVLGIELWTNTGSGDVLSWEKEWFDYNTPTGVVRRDAIKTVGQRGYDININVNYQDIPAISDIDGDGLPDILCFGLTTALPQGVTLEYFRQTAPLTFSREDYCWGGFVQAYTSNDIYLDVCSASDTVSTHKPDTRMMHLGSALLAMDVSGNGVKDIIMGELSFPNATVVYNTGSVTYAHMTHCDVNFPSDDVPVHLENLPAFYAVDIDHDGDDELIVAPAVTGSENHNNVMLYKNMSDGGEKRFVLSARDFMVGEMIDVGENSRVVFVDVDRDGLEDMIVSSYGYYIKNGGGYSSRLLYYKNIGNRYTPMFELKDDDWAGLSRWKKEGLHPAIADVNADGMVDLVIGDSYGFIHLLYGIKDKGFVPERYYVAGIDVGNTAMPTLWDVNEDGLLDIVVGAADGYLHLLENTGTRTKPVFTLKTHMWAGVDYSRYASQGNSLCPSFYRKDGRVYMLLGLYDGRVAKYEWKGNDTMVLINEDEIGMKVGKNATQDSFVTRHGDRYMACGNKAGGLLLFVNKTETSSLPNDTSIHNMTIYPNPCRDILYISCEGEDIECWTLYDMSGRSVMRGNDMRVEVKHLSHGVYVIRVKGVSGKIYNSKVVVQ